MHLILLFSGLTVGFGHCIGMCGPIVVSLSLSLRGRGALGPHILYNAGRITTYGLLGGAMGATGSFAYVAAHITSFQKGVMIFAGVLIVLLGLAVAGWLPGGNLLGDSYRANGVLARGFRRLTASRSVLACYPLGLLLGLLPCGPVYTALITAARVGMEAERPLEGMMEGSGLLLAFGLGTVPAMLLVAKLMGLGWLKRRERLYKVGSLLMVILGVYFVIKGIRY